MEKKSGSAANMGKWGPDESSQAYQNKVFRDLHLGGHDLNHSYKNPVPSVSPDVKKAGTNHSYYHPLVDPAKENSPQAQVRGNRIVPVNQTGKGK
jgi:hypothetical protein